MTTAPHRRKHPHAGRQPRRYSFFLNPYPDVRLTNCPRCRKKTHQRKLPLFIHLEPAALLVLNKTCRYCPRCGLLIAHRDDLEDLMTRFFAARNPKILGNDYLVVGTVDRAAWRRGRDHPMEPREMLKYLNEFKKVVQFELIGGWRPGEDTGR